MEEEDIWQEGFGFGYQVEVGPRRRPMCQRKGKGWKLNEGHMGAAYFLGL